jgi:hypothetical protein
VIGDAHALVPEIVRSLGDFDDLLDVEERRADVEPHALIFFPVSLRSCPPGVPFPRVLRHLLSKDLAHHGLRAARHP